MLSVAHAVQQLTTKRYISRFEQVLGTSMQAHVDCHNLQQLQHAEDALFAELDRLEKIYSVFDPSSELNRWQRCDNQNTLVSGDLAWLLAEALHWQTYSQGVFCVGIDALTRAWKTGKTPPPTVLEQIVHGLKQPLYTLQHNRASRHHSHIPLNFNAFAKGRIVDVACQAAKNSKGVSSVLLNIGGDIRHMGKRSMPVNIANPFQKADNLPPVTTVQIANQAVATSGKLYRGFMVDGTWYSHILDPRSGYPVAHTVAVSVLADDCATADALATIFSVLAPEQSLHMADSLPRVGCFLQTPTHTHQNAFWTQHEVKK